MGTTIPCGERTHERLEELRDDEFRSWDAFLNYLMDEYEQQDHEVMESNNQPQSSGLDESRLAEYLADYLINGENLPEKVAGELR